MLNDDLEGRVLAGDDFDAFSTPLSETPSGFLIFVGVYVACSFFFLIPVALWTRWDRRRRGRDVRKAADAAESQGQEMVRMEGNNSGENAALAAGEGANALHLVSGEEQPRGATPVGEAPPVVSKVAVPALPNASFAPTDRAELAMKTWPAASRIHPHPAGRGGGTPDVPSTENGHDQEERTDNHRPHALNPASGEHTPLPTPALDDEVPSSNRLPTTDRRPADQSSTVLSAATTSQLRRPSNAASGVRRRQRTSSSSRNSATFQLVSDMGARMGLTQGFPQAAVRAQAVKRFVHAERQQAGSGVDEAGSGTTRSRDPSWLMSQRPGRRPSLSQTSSRMSDAAGFVLTGEVVDGESDFYRQRFYDRARRSRRRRGSVSSAASDFSLMPPLNPEALAPEDAADANDPGRANVFQYQDIPPPPRATFSDTGFCLSRCGGFLDCVEPDSEMRRILRIAVPSVAGAVADKVLRLVLIGIISYYINTQSMVAFVLVTIFLRLTVDAVSGSITDTEVTNIQTAMAGGGEDAFYKSGQIIQLALIVQILLGVPILVGWVYGIKSLVNWLLSEVSGSEKVVELAFEYMQVIVLDYFFRVVGKTFLVPFHMNGRAPFETIIDVVGAVLTMIAIGVVAGTGANVGDRPTLVSVAWIQVINSVVKFICKVAYVCLKGWFQPYRDGFFGRLTFLDTRSVGVFIITSVPLFIGSLIELREWEILTLFVRAVGPGEVTTWAIMGAVWELFEASADGLGGAGAMRISYYLAENEPGEARIISLKVVFLGAIQAFCFSSIFLMIGPDLSVWLTKNTILQNMFYHLTGITAVTNFSMTFALTCWSLVGMGQGRFGIATVIIVLCRWLVVYPLAGIAVFRFHHEINSVSGAIAVGYATAGFALGCVLIRSDWKQLSLDAQEAFYPPDENGIPEVGEEAEDNDATGNEDADGEDDSNSSSDTDSIIL